MEKLIEKLNLKDLHRICIINPEPDIISAIHSARPTLDIDTSIDPRYLYNFFLAFVSSPSQVEDLTPGAVHNLYEDGILWYAYPRITKEEAFPFSKEKGWDILKTLGFKAVRQITINEDWNGIRFRNSRFVRNRISSREN